MMQAYEATDKTLLLLAETWMVDAITVETFQIGQAVSMIAAM